MRGRVRVYNISERLNQRLKFLVELKIDKKITFSISSFIEQKQKIMEKIKYHSFQNPRFLQPKRFKINKWIEITKISFGLFDQINKTCINKTIN